MLFKSESEVITILYITKNNYNSLKKNCYTSRSGK